MMDTFSSPIRAMEQLKGKSADNILAVVLLDRLEMRLKAEWTRHRGSTTNLPNVNEILEFFENHES